MKVSFTLRDFEQQLIKFSPIVPDQARPGRPSRTVRIAQFSLSNSQAQPDQGLILYPELGSSAVQCRKLAKQSWTPELS